MKFLLYGANGYTGQLIIPIAIAQGLEPILSGRTESKIKPLAKQYNLPYRIANLEENESIDNALKDVDVVLHCAGPFMYTAEPMIEACLRTKTHYLDITGEIAVFKTAHDYDEDAQHAGIMLMSGTGFDVVPTDCMAMHLKNKMPSATHLQLGFYMNGAAVSHGTATTSIENLGEEGMVRKNGELTPVPIAHKTKTLNFDGKKRTLATIPWGDVYTAYFTTAIPNIEVYFGMPPMAIRLAKLAPYFGWLLRMRSVKNFLINRVKSRPAGPDEQQRDKAVCYIWGEVKNDKGGQYSAMMTTIEGYNLTAQMAVHITKKVLNKDYKSGYQTPAKAYGEGLILEIEGNQFL